MKSIKDFRAKGHKLALVKYQGPKLCSIKKDKLTVLMDLTYSEYQDLSERGVYEVKGKNAKSRLYTH